MLEHDRGAPVFSRGWWLQPDSDPAVRAEGQADGHFSSCQRTQQDYMIGVEFDRPNVRGCATRIWRKAQREGKWIEPLSAARSGRQWPACCLTPQSLSPRRGIIPRFCARICLRYLRQTCLKQFGIHLMFLVNPPYCSPALLHMLD